VQETLGGADVSVWGLQELLSFAAEHYPDAEVVMNCGWDGSGTPTSIVVFDGTIYINHTEAHEAWNGRLTELAPGVYRLEPEQKE
jgi:hypothetical protein